MTIAKKNLLYIGNKLSGKGKTVTTIEELGSRLELQGYAVTYASSVSNKLLRMLHMVYVFLKEAKTTNVVLIDTYSTSNFYYAVIIGRLCTLYKVSYIPILHGGNLEIRLKNNPKLSSHLFKNSKTNVAPSKFLESVFLNYGFHVVHIPNALEIENYPYKKRLNLQCKLLWVRSFATLYNPEMAVKVCEQLNSSGVNATLCMVGPDKDGSLETCKSYAESHNIPVTFTGKLAKEEWIAMAADYDIFINTTTIDNTPVSVLEAMALGLPVVSTNVGGVPFMIENGENGLLVTSGNVEEMVAAINRLLVSTTLVETITDNAKQYTDQVDWEVVKDKWNTVLQG
ncbi:glycosyltransferase family 4 protein [Neptunitalea lumnitzerae]|uniref:1,2-diacylglycerol 3-glucosyltransferase n=1 Tax=Neptunitalea lumnitzerae TaxID=2965509 RepID=A0ABQ5MND0_9FLAO|nr:glycosyltransferase family 4 protein [Neptunitalea sp. Y10]GLB50853.1 1,2-diacylglycerol 3-glucosyltransferase [Neptunitalea sp. Y10]